MRHDGAVLLRFWEFARAVFMRYSRHRNSIAAAGLGFFIALSLAPAAVAIGSFVGLVISPNEVARVLDDVQLQIPGTTDQASTITQSLIQLFERASTTSVTLTSIVSTLIAVYAASRFVYALRLSLDTVNDIDQERVPWWSRLFAAVITLAVFIVIAAALFVVTVLPSILQALGLSFTRITTGSGIVDWLIGAVVIYLLTRLTYRYAPHSRVSIPWLSWGAAFTTVWVIGLSLGVGLYASWSSTIGAAIAVLGTSVVLIFWLYLASVGFLIGAEIDAYLEDDRTSSEPPSEDEGSLERSVS